jgi:hypothetical protein
VEETEGGDVTDEDARDELSRLERDRCRAIAEDDFDRLGELLSARLIHVHTRGNRDTRGSYLAYLRDVVDILEVRRGELAIDVHRDCAVMCGPQTNVARPRDSDQPPLEVASEVMQVWTRDDGGWRQVAFQATPLGAAPPPLPR